MVRLKKYLNYEISTVVLYALSLQIFFFIFLASLAAFIFTPFMLYVLYTEKKKGWLILFVIIVIVPTVLLLISSTLFEFSRPLLFIVLGLLYFYFLLLRFDVNNWAREELARKQYLMEKKKREEELESFTDRFNR